MIIQESPTGRLKNKSPRAKSSRANISRYHLDSSAKPISKLRKGERPGLIARCSGRGKRRALPARTYRGLSEKSSIYAFSSVNALLLYYNK